MKLSTLSAALLAATTSSGVFAENTSLDQVIVTANNTEQSARSVTSNMTVITAEQIEEKQYQTLADALRTVPGIMLKGSGGLGKTTSMYMRGDTQAHILILQDGVDLTDAAGLGGARIENIQLSDVERIEIIKGSQSGVWGANATAGVINIITKKGGHQASVNLQIGSNNTRKISTTLGDSNKQGDFVVHFSTLNTDGFSAVRAANISHTNFEDDGFKQTDISLKFGINLAKHHRIETFIKTSSADNEFDGTTGSPLYLPAPDDNKATNQYTNIIKSLQYRYSKGPIKTRVFIRDNLVEREYPSYSSLYNGNVREIGAQLGYDYRGTDNISVLTNRKVFDSSSNNYTNHGFAISNTNNITHNLIVTESLRYDDFDKFDNVVTGKIGVKHYLNSDVFASANYGTAYNAPLLSQLARPNPVALVPEKTQSYDMTLGAYGLELTYFYNKTKDLIEYVPQPYPTPYYYENAAQEVLTDGIEASYKRSIKTIQTDLGLNFTWLSARNENGESLKYRPEHTANLNVDYYGLSKTHLGLETRYIGRQYSADHNAGVQLGEYFVTDLKADYEMSKTLTFYAKVTNLMDDQYTDNVANATGSTANYVYSNGGRQFFIGLRGQL
ncbi:TonB-dependent receptor plug domain-containing protein [Thiomicrorhabdus arctica]|jgi:vitamin B12 transporter|uniref:TonB-dependent receptor plug domain-containing protein n=1 Tax=Thiomicrorhabdus arctica TaxID=131540 RepID=UPI00035C8D8A|nr:TonB-dependent receptor [Thiomicrorhabdus arctica]